MEINNVVPKIITGKDLDYLSDLFSWNYAALKKTNESINNITDDEGKDLLKKAFNIFNNNLNVVLDTLKGGTNE